MPVFLRGVAKFFPDACKSESARSFAALRMTSLRTTARSFAALRMTKQKQTGGLGVRMTSVPKSKARRLAAGFFA
jgi:hypothetical protein